jgi:hypothetical protein
MESSAQRAELDLEALDRRDTADFVYGAAGKRVLQRRS